MAKDGAEQRYIAYLIASVGSEEGLNCRYGTESDVGEGLSKEDGFFEVADGEIVLAGCNRSLPGPCEDAVGAEGMQFLLLWTTSVGIDQAG